MKNNYMYERLEAHNGLIAELMEIDSEVFIEVSATLRVLAINLCCDARKAGIDAHVDMDTCEVLVGRIPSNFLGDVKTFEYVDEEV